MENPKRPFDLPLILYLFTLKRYTQVTVAKILSRIYHLADNKIHLVSDKPKINVARILSTDLCAR